MPKSERFMRFGAVIAVGIFLGLLVFAPAGVSVAGDGGAGGPQPGTDTTRPNIVIPDTTTTSTSGGNLVTPGFWLIWLF